MDEQKEKTVPEEAEVLEVLKAQRSAIWDEPFIVEIMAAILFDSYGLDKSKQLLTNPDSFHNADVLIDFMESKTQHLREDALKSGEAEATLYDIIPGYRAELNPESRDFVVKHYRAAVNEMGSKLFLDGVRKRLSEIIKEQETIAELLPEISKFPLEMQAFMGRVQFLGNGTGRFGGIFRTEDVLVGRLLHAILEGGIGALGSTAVQRVAELFQLPRNPSHHVFYGLVGVGLAKTAQIPMPDTRIGHAFSCRCRKFVK